MRHMLERLCLSILQVCEGKSHVLLSLDVPMDKYTNEWLKAIRVNHLKIQNTDSKDTIFSGLMSLFHFFPLKESWSTFWILGISVGPPTTMMSLIDLWTILAYLMAFFTSSNMSLSKYIGLNKVPQTWLWWCWYRSQLSTLPSCTCSPEQSPSADFISKVSSTKVMMETSSWEHKDNCSSCGFI